MNAYLKRTSQQAIARSTIRHITASGNLRLLRARHLTLAKKSYLAHIDYIIADSNFGYRGDFSQSPPLSPQKYAYTWRVFNGQACWQVIGDGFDASAPYARGVSIEHGLEQRVERWIETAWQSIVNQFWVYPWIEIIPAYKT
jgi:hypothetical protein